MAELTGGLDVDARKAPALLRAGHTAAPRAVVPAPTGAPASRGGPAPDRLRYG